MTEKVRKLVAASSYAMQVLGDTMEGCVSEGCSQDKPCSYCQDATDAIKDLGAAMAELKSKRKGKIND